MNRQIGNVIKTMMLFIVLWGVLLLIGGFISRSTRNPLWIIIFAAFGLIGTFVTYWNSAKFALRQMRAYPADPVLHASLFRIVQELSTKADQPVPTIWIAPTSTPNAFATGRNPSNAAVCCTEGILGLLDERELRGVLGHELMHVYNRDILTSSVASAMAGVITSAAQFVIFFGPGRSRDDEDSVNPIAGLLLMILAPFAAMLIQLAISRTREYDADLTGSQLSEDPLALASALKKLEQGDKAVPMEATPANANVASMMIANPFKGGGITQLFSTHPPMEERIKRLEELAGY